MRAMKVFAVPALVTFAVGIGGLAGACGSSNSTQNNASGDDASSADGTTDGSTNLEGGDDGALNPDGATADAGSVDSSYPCSGCNPFPAAGTPACAPTALGAPTIAYPPDGVLLPPNMNVLEVQFVPPAGATLFEVSFTNSITDVRVETQCNPVPDVRGGPSMGCGVTLPLAAWQDIANHNRDGDPVHVTVRATKDGTCVAASTTKVDLAFAKDDLAGGIYYWQSATYGGIAGTTGGIYSHDFGTFDPTPAPFYTSGATGTCVGCHNLSRDGQRMAVATDDPDADDEFGDVRMHVMDVGARSVVGGKNLSPGFQTFTHDHAKLFGSNWKAQNVSFTVWDGNGATLLATDTLPAATAATQPDLSKDDGTLVFVVPKAGTIWKLGDHHFAGGSLYTATFNPATSAMGAPTSLLAATGTQNFYYPQLSPDQSFVVFNAAPDGDAFYNRNARVKLLHLPSAAGATPIDLAALNVKDGLTNSWPRWSPFVQTYKGHKLLWLTFSSNRDYGLHLVNQPATPFKRCYPTESPTGAPWNDNVAPNWIPASKTNVTFTGCEQPQIWMAGVIIDPSPSLDAGDRSFPAFWLPFQDVNSHNHSAQWVEKVVAPPVGTGGDAGPDGSTDGAPACVAIGGSCASSPCCADGVCCGSTCQATCIQ